MERLSAKFALRAQQLADHFLTLSENSFTEDSRTDDGVRLLYFYNYMEELGKRVLGLAGVKTLFEHCFTFTAELRSLLHAADW